MRIKVNETITDTDLARALEGDAGTFLVQQAGRNYLVSAEPGHSISSLRPIGQIELPVSVGSHQAFAVTKLSNRPGADWEGDSERHQERARN